MIEASSLSHNFSKTVSEPAGSFSGRSVEQSPELVDYPAPKVAQAQADTAADVIVNKSFFSRAKVTLVAFLVPIMLSVYTAEMLNKNGMPKDLNERIVLLGLVIGFALSARTWIKTQNGVPADMDNIKLSDLMPEPEM